jgi:hypothetical protein
MVCQDCLLDQVDVNIGVYIEDMMLSDTRY